MQRISLRLLRWPSLAAGLLALAAFALPAAAQAPFESEKNIQLRGNFAAPILVDEGVPFARAASDVRQGGGSGGDKTNYYPVSGNWLNASTLASVDLYQNSYGQYVMVFYRESGGVPSWYMTDNAYLVNNALTNVPLYLVRWDYATGATKPLIQVGTVTMSFSSNTTSSFSWSIFGLFGSGTFNAAWYGGSGRVGMYYPFSTPGLGAMFSSYGNYVLVNFAYYDASGNPIWARGIFYNSSYINVVLSAGTSYTNVGTLTYWDSGYPGYFNGSLDLANTFMFSNQAFFPLAF